MSVTDTRSVGSIVGGETRYGRAARGVAQPGGPRRAWSARRCSGDVDTFVDACRAARAAQAEWAATPAPVRGNAIKQIGRLVEDNKEALARLLTREIGKPYPESLGEVQEIVDTCDFFLSEGRRLYGMTVPSEMPDKQLFTFRNPVGRGGDHHRRELPGGGALLVHRARAPLRERGGLEAGRVRARPRRRARAALHRRRAARRGAQPRAVRRADRLRGPRARARGAARGQGRLHRVVRGGRPDRRALRPQPAVALPRARRQEPARGHARRRPRPGGRGSALQRLRHGRAALHLARHGDRPSLAARGVREPAHPRCSRTRRSATRSPTCSTGR